MTRLSRRQFLTSTALLLNTSSFHVRAAPGADSATESGLGFLTSLFNPELGLLPEFPGARVYWLYHDNYLAAKLLAGRDPEKARRITDTIESYGVKESGKIEVLFDEAARPLPFRGPMNLDLRRVGNAVVRTEVAGQAELKGWEEYADLRFLASMALARDNPEEAAIQLEAGLATWDGLGFRDRVVGVNGLYATYKLALAILAAQKLKRPLVMHGAIVERLALQQHPEGGWITDYDANRAPRGLPSVETTCIVLMGLAAGSR